MTRSRSARVAVAVKDDDPTNTDTDATTNLDSAVVATVDALVLTPSHRRSTVRSSVSSDPRGSLMYRSVVDAMVTESEVYEGEHGAELKVEVDDRTTRPMVSAMDAPSRPSRLSVDRRRSGQSLSTADRSLAKKASVVLTNPLVAADVLARCAGQRAPRIAKCRSPVVALTLARDRSTRTVSEEPSRHRVALQRLVQSAPFRGFLVGVTLSDLLVLALNTNDSSVASTRYALLDLLLTLLLLLELALKSIAFGAWRGPHAYFRRSKSHVLSLACLVLSVADHMIHGLRGTSSSLRVFHGLKTARCLTMHAGLRRILKSLLRAIPFLTNVATLALFFLLAFAIFGLEAYKGVYSRQCVVSIPSALSSSASASSSSSSSLTGADALQLLTALPPAYCSRNASCAGSCQNWPQPSRFIHFDSGVSSLFLVFLVAAQDGWTSDIMRPVVEATSELSVFFFAGIVAVLVFLVVNLFVAVITTSFMTFSVEADAQATQTEVTDSAGACATQSMTKMHPHDEETRVSLILGATLAIDESRALALAAQSEEGGDGDRQSRASASAYHHQQLLRTHKYHTLRNLTVVSTLELLQNMASAEEVLARAYHHQQQQRQQQQQQQQRQQYAAAHRSIVVPDRRGLDETTTTADTPQATPGNFVDPDIDPAITPIQPVALPPPRDESWPYTTRWFLRFEAFVLSKRFDDAITGCIAVNTLTLLVEHQGMSTALIDLLSVTEYVFGVIFAGEMLARMLALRGLHTYLRSTERFFDMLVVGCTTVNLVLNSVPSAASYSGLNSVSSMRTLRVGRLMMKWEGTRTLIESVLKSSRGVVDVVAFMILFQVVNAIVAMQVFGGTHLGADPLSPPRWNFDTFPHSFLTLLQVITGDQWASVTYDAVDASDPHWLLVPFLVFNFIVGQHVLLNLFIAVILENFALSEEEAYQLQLEQVIATPKELDIYEKIEEQGVRAFGEMEQLENVSNVKLRLMLGLDDAPPAGPTTATTAANAIAMPTAAEQGTHSEVVRSMGLSVGSMRLWSKRYLHGQARHEPTTRWRRLWRQCCRRLLASRVFQGTVQAMIFTSCVTLVLEDPNAGLWASPPSQSFTTALAVVNRIVLAVFLFEAVAKISVAGLGLDYVRVALFHHDERLGFVPRQAYLEDSWNQLDLALLLLTLADEGVSAADASLTIAHAFRAGRVLRPLRILNHHPEMKAILRAVAQSLPHVGNVFALCSIVYIIFGVVGRSLFAGKLYACNDESVTLMAQCVGFFQQFKGDDGDTNARPVLVPRVWRNARFSFDNTGAAFLTLLEMTSLKWVDKVFVAIDVAGGGLQPVRDAAPWHALFFVLFVYIGSLFVIRLFVGVLVEQFQRNNGTQILTEAQKAWVDLEKFVLLLKPLARIPRPPRRWQNALYDLCQSAIFTRGIAVVIMLNVLLLLFNPAKTTNDATFFAIELLFLTIFALEATCKCLAFRHHFVLSSGGAFELGLLAGSLLAYSLNSNYHSLIQAGRVFRMLRVLRFVRLNRGLYAVFQTFRASLGPITHIFFLLFTIFFIFAIVGRQLFGNVRFGRAVTPFAHFRSFASAFRVLFQIMSGDDWHLTMTDCMTRPPFCVAHKLNAATGSYDSDCGSVPAAVLFFATYVTLVVFIFLNLFIAVVLENFRSCYLQGDVCPISLHDFEAYREVFSRYEDALERGTIPLHRLAAFLRELPPGLRVDSRSQRLAFLQLRTQAAHALTTSRCADATDAKSDRAGEGVNTADVSPPHPNRLHHHQKPQPQPQHSSLPPPRPRSQPQHRHHVRHRRGRFGDGRRPFFNELLRILCIHQLGIRALPYEQQRDRVKQIFLYRAKVANMILEAALLGFVHRWRIRRERRQREVMARGESVPPLILTATTRSEGEDKEMVVREEARPEQTIRNHHNLDARHEGDNEDDIEMATAEVEHMHCEYKDVDASMRISDKAVESEMATGPTSAIGGMTRVNMDDTSPVDGEVTVQERAIAERETASMSREDADAHADVEGDVGESLDDHTLKPDRTHSPHKRKNRHRHKHKHKHTHKHGHRQHADAESDPVEVEKEEAMEETLVSKPRRLPRINDGMGAQTATVLPT